MSLSDASSPVITAFVLLWSQWDTGIEEWRRESWHQWICTKLRMAEDRVGVLGNETGCSQGPHLVCYAKEFDIYSKSRKKIAIFFTEEISAHITQKRSTTK